MGKKSLLSMAAVSMTFLLTISGVCWSQSSENTGINKRDRSEQEMTADQQGQSKQDVEMTRKIRREIVNDKSLSTDAHNVKIVTSNGMVTLKGPVKSQEEKMAVEKKAAQIAGEDRIKNEIHVSAGKGDKQSS